MDSIDIKPLVAGYHRKLATTNLTFKRYLYNKINWNVRLVGIKGARGVGKTTMLVQRIKETFNNVDDAFYVSLDNLWFDHYSLIDLVEYLYTRGITHLYFDEVHKYPNWIATLKNLYDDYPDLQIVYTGSSMLDIDNSKSDLSRRQSLYTLNGLSFREYLEYEGILSVEPIEFTELLSQHVDYAMNVTGRIKVLKHFETYLQTGCYPFYKEVDTDYYMRLNEVARLVIENDLPSVEEVTFATIQKTKKLLMILAQSVPLVPNISQLCGQLETTRDLCFKMLYALDKAGILYLLTEKIKSYKHLAKPEKIYLANTNLMYALSINTPKGSVRETFFANQVGVDYSLTMPQVGDFRVNDKYLFEVGGSSKTFDQIADVPNSYLAIDDIETGYGNRIPLWLFGMLY
ncbi:MAG: AAA family ATPase [Acinetobacter sp.]